MGSVLSASEREDVCGGGEMERKLGGSLFGGWSVTARRCSHGLAVEHGTREQGGEDKEERGCTSKSKRVRRIVWRDYKARWGWLARGGDIDWAPARCSMLVALRACLSEVVGKKTKTRACLGLTMESEGRLVARLHGQGSWLMP
jgi:hypothetical protein